MADVAAFGGDNRIDYAVNCAGILGPPLRSHEVAPEQFDRINGVNYRGSWLVSRAVLGRMVAQEAVVRGPTWGGGRGWGERGCVVNIASQLGIVARPEAGEFSFSFFFTPAPLLSTLFLFLDMKIPKLTTSHHRRGVTTHTAAYCASKSAVIGMTKADAIDYARDGIRVNCVCPGVIETPMTVGSPELAERMRPAVDIAPMRRMGTPEEVAAAVLFLCSGDASFVQGHALVVDGGYTIN